MAKLVTKFREKIQDPKFKEYLMSTHFWGPFANWGIPLAALADINRDPKFISGKMTLALCLYSCTFMRFAWRVQPQNLQMFACHILNAATQSVALSRYLHYHYYLKQG